MVLRDWGTDCWSHVSKTKLVVAQPPVPIFVGSCAAYKKG